MAEYKIKTSEGLLPVKGTKVGKYLGVRKIGEGRTAEYAVDHIPTGLRITTMPWQKGAKQVATTLDMEFGDLLSEADSSTLSRRMSEQSRDVIAWLAQVQLYPNFEEWKRRLGEQDVRKSRLADVKKKFSGKVVHFVKPGPHYGLEGKLTNFREETPGVFKVTLQKGGGSYTHMTIALDDVVLGKAPANMPWVRTGSGDDEIARIRGVRWTASQVGRIDPSGLLWTTDSSRISKYDPRMFPGGIEAAKRFAERGLSSNPTKARLMR